MDGIDLEGNILNITNNEAVKNFLENYKELEPYLEQLNNIKEGETLKVLLDNDIASKDEPHAIEGEETSDTLALEDPMNNSQIVPSEGGASDLTHLNDLIKSVPTELKSHIKLEGNELKITKNDDVISFFQKQEGAFKPLADQYLNFLDEIDTGDILTVLLDNDSASKDGPDAIEGGEFDLVSVGNENTNTLALSGDMTGLKMFGNDTGIVANFVQNYIEINGSDVEVSPLNLEDLNKLLEMLPETIKTN